MIFERLVPLSDRTEWDRALIGIPHSFAHTWESSHAMHLTHGLDTYLYTYNDGNIRIVCPICERYYRGYKDVVTPFGFPGFVGTGPCPEFQSHWKRFSVQQQYVCGYFGINPILSDPSYFNPNDVYEYNKIFVFDLTLSVEELYANLLKGRKNQLNRWDEERLKITLDKQLLTDFFLDNYHDFIKSRNASSIYSFSLETLSAIVSGENSFLFGIKENGRIIAVEVLVYTKYFGDSLFNISVDEGRRYGTILTWYALNYFKSIRVPYYNLGGGRHDNDSVAFYKKRFGTREFPLKGLKQVYDKNVYADLCKQVSADPDDKTGFFPPFHKEEIN